MSYAKAFFDLQLRFAETVSALSGTPLPSALLRYTNFYIRFGLGRAFDPDHPLWREYVAGLERTADQRDWTYHFYLKRSEQPVLPPNLVATFGCFSYSRLSSDHIRLHFQNDDLDGGSPLAAERRDQRLADLAAMSAYIKRTERQPRHVVGASWLYNLEAYRRLFPVSYLATGRVIHGRFQHMPLWGQFLDRHGEVKDTLTHEFLERLTCQSSLNALDQCFPFQVLALEAPASEFYEHYGV